MSSASRRSSRPAVDPLERRELLTLLGQQLFPSDNPWNQDIASAPVAADSSAIINNIIGLYGDGRFHPDFGQDTGGNNPLYGIPFNVVHGNAAAKVHVVVDGYPSESDLQDAPIPANAIIEGDEQNGPTVGLANRGDSHLIVWDEDNNIAYEFDQASRPSENTDGRWHAAQETVWDMKTDTFRTLGWTSADAAGLAILPGLLRPDEALPVAQGGQGAIDHAIRITLKNNIILDQFLYPASHVANPGNTNAAVQPPMGARLRLKASVDISGLDPESKVVAQAMKDYGVIVADNGSNFFASGASDSVDASNNRTLTWNDADIQDTTHGLKSLTFSDFEVIDTTPIVTGLSASTGAAGSTITVIGSGFSGAAGRLSVLFAGASAMGVTVLDDSHVTAVVPTGSGTVDVQVRSGVTTPSDPENIKGTIFGYGTSAATSADRFTYSAANQPPTVARPASASPSAVTGTSTALSVLGADDGGEANLTYAWTATSAPTGASPAFAANATNAAKATTVTFDRAGAYTFQAVITDKGGLTASSSVNVTVAQTPTSLAISPSTAAVANGATRQFTAQELDQFGRPMAAQPGITWTVFGGAGSIGAAGLYTAPASGPATAVVLAQGGGMSAEASVIPPGQAAIFGALFLDPLGIGSLSGGPLVGRTVYADLAGTGSFQAGDPAGVTNAFGVYLIPGLAAGGYTVRPILFPGEVATTAAGRGQSVATAAGRIAGAATIGLLSASPVLPLSFGPAPFGAHNPDLATAEVNGLYQTIVGRGPDPVGLANSVAFLKAGGSLRTLASILLGTGEYQTILARSAYVNFLGRAPSAAEVNAWANAIRQGKLTPEQVAYDFLISNEFNALHPDNASFIMALYADVFGLVAGPSDLAAWAKVMASGTSRAQAVAAILHSPTAARRAVEGLAAIFPGQALIPSDEQSDVAYLVNGGSLADLAAAFAALPGFAARAALTVG